MANSVSGVALIAAVPSARHRTLMAGPAIFRSTVGVPDIQATRTR